MKSRTKIDTTRTVRRRTWPLALVPLFVLVLFAGGADADAAQRCNPTVYAPKKDLHLEVQKAFPAHDPWVRTLAFHPCRPILVSGGSDGALRYWDVSKKDPTASVQTWWSPDGGC